MPRSPIKEPADIAKVLIVVFASYETDYTVAGNICQY